MEIYLVGGAVRDRLLGLAVHERDYVVVGATEAEMRRAGYRSVGKEFPVFLHPDSREEYALARTERKTGRGHTGFECSTDSVTLEQDLQRRDLTINAMAEDHEGHVIDPWGGLHDLEARVLRHVSAAFEEDPLRVLRVARFAARFAGLGFTIAPETLALMQHMVRRGDLAELSPERVWLELDKALHTDTPEVFFQVLSGTGAGTVLWPELQAESTTTLARIRVRSGDQRFRYAALLLEIPVEQGARVSDRLRAPNRFAEFARLATGQRATWRQAKRLAPADKVAFLYAIDAFRQPERFSDFNEFLRLADDQADDTAKVWKDAFEIARQVSASAVDPGLKGSDIGAAIREEQARQLQAKGA